MGPAMSIYAELAEKPPMVVWLVPKVQQPGRQTLTDLLLARHWLTFGLLCYGP